VAGLCDLTNGRVEQFHCIALQMGKIATVGLASAIAVPWMTISGSMLANWWRNKPMNEKEK
jgi:BASS family bile acid:Na+ symporter